MRPARAWCFAAVAALTVGALAASPASSSQEPSDGNAAPAQTQAQQEIPFAFTSGEDPSFEQLVIESVRSGATAVGDAQVVVRGLQEVAASGRDVELPGVTRQSDANELELTQAALAAEKRGEGPDYAQMSIATDADPDNYRKRGRAINDRRSWRLKNFFRAGFCRGDSCAVTDKITQRWTVDPGRGATRFSFTSVYSPKSEEPRFEEVWATIGSYTARGVNLGDRDAGRTGDQNGSGSAVATVTHDRDAKGLSIQGLIRPRARDKVQEKVLVGRYRTGRAKCPTARRARACIYL